MLDETEKHAKKLTQESALQLNIKQNKHKLKKKEQKILKHALNKIIKKARRFHSGNKKVLIKIYQHNLLFKNI